MELMDGRTGRVVHVGDVLRSVERGDLVRVASIEDAPEHSPHPLLVTLVPLGEPFTSFGVVDGGHDGASLDGFWLA